MAKCNQLTSLPFRGLTMTAQRSYRKCWHTTNCNTDLHTVITTSW